MKSRQIVLASRPIGMPGPENFRFENIELGPLKEGEVLLKSLVISVDPYMRGRMNDVKSYAASFQVDEPFYGGVIAMVTETRNNMFTEGDVVYGTLPWSEFSVSNGKDLRIVDASSVPAAYYLGILGMPGLTAYFGITEIGKPGKGETVVISGAAGAVGLVAGQIAKIRGSRVVGIAGSDEKCKMLKDDFGFDETINYKTTKSIRKELARVCPDGVDVYFDNVGGDITNAVVLNLNFYSRFILCGQISYYNAREFPVGPVILPRLLTRSVMLKGFIVRDFQEKFDEGLAHLAGWLKEGKLKYTVTSIRGFDNLPDAFLGLFSGKNKGKMVVEIE
jgi:NADPH-dependent curcumin reductase CurA